MTAMPFDEIWEAVKNLPRKQQRRLQKLLDGVRCNRRLLTREHEIDLLLLKEGVINNIPCPPTEADIKAFREYQPIHVDGKPLSETIVEERR